jgi:soluble lytic murein transglycosylase-like protein
VRRGTLRGLSLPRAALCLAALPGAAHADVFQVGAGGSVAVLASDGGLSLGGAVTDSPIGAGPAPEAAPEVPVAALTTIDTPAVPPAYQAQLASAAAAANVSPTLLAALVWQESRWHADALSPKGARGLTQLMPGTARALAVDPGDTGANLAGGARYLRAMLDRFGGDVERALAAYNAGPGRVQQAGGIPAITETRAYVTSIINRLALADAAVLEGVKP